MIEEFAITDLDLQKEKKNNNNRKIKGGGKAMNEDILCQLLPPA
jgi:hypothetical protein